MDCYYLIYFQLIQYSKMLLKFPLLKTWFHFISLYRKNCIFSFRQLFSDSCANTHFPIQFIVFFSTRRNLHFNKNFIYE